MNRDINSTLGNIYINKEITDNPEKEGNPDSLIFSCYGSLQNGGIVGPDPCHMVGSRVRIYIQVRARIRFLIIVRDNSPVLDSDENFR